MAYRLLERVGRIDVDAFFASMSSKNWREYKIAKAINDSYDEWVELVKKGHKKNWTPPKFGLKKRVRRRLDGSEY